MKFLMGWRKQMSNRKNELMPHVNINGTSASELVEQQLAVMVQATCLLDALRAAAPHARDWQTRPDYEYKSARIAHSMLVEDVTDVYRTAEQIAVAIQMATAERSRPSAAVLVAGAML